MPEEDLKAAEESLFDLVAECADDPLKFVLGFFPWDTDPAIQLVKLPEPWASKYPNCTYGPDRWACELLDEIGRQCKEHAFDGRHAVAPIRVAVASGHGIGKSALTAWLVCWIMSTRPGCHGIVTANTASQIAGVTWAQILTWMSRCLTRHWFDCTTEKICAKERPSDWFVMARTSDESMSEKFAGQHAASSTSFYIFDEASAIPDKIWDVAEGGLTDGEPMIFVFGNPTRNSGRFFECFNRQRDRWTLKKVDSREAQLTNKASIAEWAKAYGEDSDFFKVRVRGEFPSQSSAQFISAEAVREAMARPSGEYHGAKIAIVGADIAMYGDDRTVFATRAGREVFDVKIYQQRGLEVCSFLQEHIMDLYKRLGFEKVYVFMDAGGVGAAHVDYMHKNGWQVEGVNFGGSADDKKTYRNKRAEMWGRMKDWLEREASKIPDSEDLFTDLTAPEYSYDTSNRIILEPKETIKKRGYASPDIADAIALTFAQHVYDPPDEESPAFDFAQRRARESRLKPFYKR